MKIRRGTDKDSGWFRVNAWTGVAAVSVVVVILMIGSKLAPPTWRTADSATVQMPQAGRKELAGSTAGGAEAAGSTLAVAAGGAAGPSAAPSLKANAHLELSAVGVDCLQPSAVDWPKKLNEHELKIFSQNGEDGILLEVFKNIGSTNRYYVEFGTQSCDECNTRVLRDLLGWKGLLMDGGHNRPEINLQTEFITPANINDLFAKYQVPEEFDFLSIDLDYDDFWVWKAIDPKYRPRVMMVEFNGNIPVNESRVVDPTDPQRWVMTFYFGASARALRDLGVKKGYTLVAIDVRGVNTIFVRSDILACQKAETRTVEEMYSLVDPSHYHNFDRPEDNTNRTWLFLDENLETVKREFRPI